MRKDREFPVLPASRASLRGVPASGPAQPGCAGPRSAAPILNSYSLSCRRGGGYSATGLSDDERSRRGEHFIRGEGGVDRVGEGRLALQPVEIGRVTSLDAMDRQGRGQQLVLVDQELRRALVGADAGVLEDLGDT